MPRNFQGNTNPYNAGAVVFGSAPTTAYFNRKQALEKAKQEAIDRSFADLEANLNEKGMRTQDIPDFLNMKNEWQSMFSDPTVRKALKDPSVDGGQSLIKFNKAVNNLRGYIEGSKNEAAKEIKALDYLKTNKFGFNKNSVGLLDLHRKKLLDPTRQSVEVEKLNFNPAPFDPITFTKGLRGNRKLTDLGLKTEVDPTDPLYDVETVTKGFSDTDVNAIGAEASAAYDSNPSYQVFIEEQVAPRVVANPQELKRYNDLFKAKFGRDMVLDPENNNDLAAAVGIDLALSGLDEKKRKINLGRKAKVDEAKAKRLIDYRGASAYNLFTKKEGYKNIDETTFPDIDAIEYGLKNPAANNGKGGVLALDVKRVFGDINRADDSQYYRSTLTPLAVVTNPTVEKIAGFKELGGNGLVKLRKAYEEAGGKSADFKELIARANKGDVNAVALIYNTVNQSNDNASERFNADDIRTAMPVIIEEEVYNPDTKTTTTKRSVTKIGSPRFNDFYNKKKNAFLQKKKAVVQNQEGDVLNSNFGVTQTTVPTSTTTTSGSSWKSKAKQVKQ